MKEIFVHNQLRNFFYQNDELFCEEVSLLEIAREVGSPTYIYSLSGIIENYKKITDALTKVKHLICYSVKANSHVAILKSLVREGSGMDVVSRGEIYRTIRAGIDGRKIVFSGVGKRYDEIRYALRNNILMFNVESLQEIELINKVGQETKKIASIALRINPDVDANTHKNISTGKKESKFGISSQQIPEILTALAEMEFVDLVGVQAHIGSQILTLDPYIRTLNVLMKWIQEIRQQGFNIQYINLGGGMGINYEIFHKPFSIEDWADAIIPQIKKEELTLLLEPGRSIVGNQGALLTRVLYVKQADTKRYAIMDAGMNDLMRPALYDAYHQIWPVEPRNEPTQIYNVVGPVCETTDFLGKERELTRIEVNDYLAVMSAGAYGFSMASRYNSRTLPAEVLVSKDRFYVIREREDVESLIDGELIPPIL